MDKIQTIPTYRLLNNNEFFLYRFIRLECLKEYPNNFGPSYSEEADSVTLKFSQYI